MDEPLLKAHLAEQMGSRMANSSGQESDEALIEAVLGGETERFAPSNGLK